MPNLAADRQRLLKDKLGAFIHHPAMSLVVVVAIMISVSLVMVHLLFDEDHPLQHPIEATQIALTVFFCFELGAKCYVAPSKGRFFAQYWIDIVAILPWTQSLRVLRILRLLRVFRVAMILTRRVRFVSALFRSAVGEYLVLGMIMTLLLVVGSFVLYASESRARLKRGEELLRHCGRRIGELEALAGTAVNRPNGVDRGSSVRMVRDRCAVLAARIRQEPGTRPVKLPVGERQHVLAELDRMLARLPAPSFGFNGEPQGLGEFENSFWATLYFLVATEPMIAVPTTTVGRLVVLVVMFGGLTTFAIFTGVVTALMVNRLKRRMEIDDMDRFQLNNHMLICGWNRLVPLMIEEITASSKGRDSAIIVVAELEEPPPEVSALTADYNVYFVSGDYTKPESLDAARVRQARLAVIVADTTRPRSDQDRDARTVLAALMIERMCPGIYTCAELLNRDNEQHLRAAGIEEVIVTSEVGGHHLAMAALHSGITEVFSELLDNKVGKNLMKVPVAARFVGMAFEDVLSQSKASQDDLVIGVEIKGQDGSRTEGYRMLVNPPRDMTLGERDNLIVISSPRRTP